MNKLRVALLILAERVVRWCPHPKWRGVLLRALGASVGTGARVDEIMVVNLGAGFGQLRIGEGAYIGAGSLLDLTGPIAIGARTAVSPGCMVLTHSDPGSMLGNVLSERHPRRVRPVTIGIDCWVGAGAIILDGVTIGDRSVVGAGTVVTRDVPPATTVVGMPAS